MPPVTLSEDMVDNSEAVDAGSRTSYIVPSRTLYPVGIKLLSALLSPLP
jgi:hypothetical protein